MTPYPIKFNPILKEKIWGGQKLKKILGKQTHANKVGESWEISDVEGNVSIVSNGAYKGASLKALIADYKSDFVGKNNFHTFGYNFPLLIKFLDAQSDLSVQVHPDDAMAEQYHNSFGKTEMWYIMDSDESASIVIGLKDETTNPEILNHINMDNVASVFNREQVKKGDSYFIPAGKIHAIGTGVLAAEIQQTSDITYRIYDWDRTNDSGQKRELHTWLAEKATKSFPSNGKVSYNLEHVGYANLVSCDYFTTTIIEIKGVCQKDYKTIDSFLIFMCVEGEAHITVSGVKEHLTMGETVLLPALCEEVILEATSARLLEIYI